MQALHVLVIQCRHLNFFWGPLIITSYSASSFLHFIVSRIFRNLISSRSVSAKHVATEYDLPKVAARSFGHPAAMLRSSARAILFFDKVTRYYREM